MDDSTIHRTLREHGVRRKNRVTDISMVPDFFPNELLTSWQHVGYRIMHQRLCANYIFLDGETVRVVLKSLNLEEVSFWQAYQFHKQKYRVEGPNQLMAMTN